jgi:hypothetical protein
LNEVPSDNPMFRECPIDMTAPKVVVKQEEPSMPTILKKIIQHGSTPVFPTRNTPKITSPVSVYDDGD